MKYINNVKIKLAKHVIKKYKKIKKRDMIIGDALFNRNCHGNSIQKAVKNNVRVYMCIVINKEDDFDIFIHFINKNKSNKYIDNTLGYQYKKYNYYTIRLIHKKEYNKIYKIFNKKRIFLIEAVINKRMRKLYNFFHSDNIEYFI